MLPGSGVARQRILVSYLVIFWHILSYFHITVRNWRPQHINYDTKRVLANELETQHFVQILCYQIVFIKIPRYSAPYIQTYSN